MLDPRVRKAGADYHSVLGRISTDWTWTPGEKFELSLTVPPNAVAHVALPAHLGGAAERAFDVGPGVHQIRI